MSRASDYIKKQERLKKECSYREPKYPCCFNCEHCSEGDYFDPFFSCKKHQDLAVNPNGICNDWSKVDSNE